MEKHSHDPRWGADDRKTKASAIITTLMSIVPDATLRAAAAVDIGCGSGEIAYHIANHVREMTGIDPEPWDRWERFRAERPNLQYQALSGERLPAADASVDLVICNQVYEHVAQPLQLISEIHRILRPGGYCYFAGPNLLFPIEPHVFWPFVHWLPRRFAVWLLRVCGSEAILDANSTHYWELKRWLVAFHIVNCVPFILRHPALYGRRGLVWRLLSVMPEWLLDSVTCLSPGFVFVLRKPPR